MILAAKQQQEAKRERRVKKNLTLLFGNIKKALDEKKDDEFIHQNLQCRIQEAKHKVEKKCTISFLAGLACGRS